MRILIVNAWSTVSTKGGAERVFCDISNALVQRGHDVCAVCFDRQEGRPQYFLNNKVEFVNAGLVKLPIYFRKVFRNVCAASFDPSRRRKRRLDWYARTFEYQLCKSLRNFNFDIAISFQPMTTYALVRVFGESLPVVTMSHNRTDVTFPQSLPVWVLQAVEKAGPVQVLLKDFVGETRRKLPDAQISVIPNVVIPSRQVLNFSSKKIVTVGRLSRQKRQVLLINAFALLKEKYPDWQVEIWGEIGEEDYYRLIVNTIKENNLEDRVKICGVSHSIFEVLETASIFAFPSEHEGWGLALTEAMSVGLPVVGCTDCSAVNSLIHHNKNGLLREPTPEQFACSLEQLMSNEERRECLGAQAHADMKQYEPEKVWQMWEELLLRTVASKKSDSGSSL